MHISIHVSPMTLWSNMTQWVSSISILQTIEPTGRAFKPKIWSLLCILSTLSVYKHLYPVINKHLTSAASFWSPQKPSIDIRILLQLWVLPLWGNYRHAWVEHPAVSSYWVKHFICFKLIGIELELVELSVGQPWHTLVSNIGANLMRS